jgi:circadian clock protein KaiC
MKRRKQELVPSLARVESGIPGLDKFLSGGFPEISTVMISGASGTGKTMFATQSLFHAASLGQKTLYVTFSEPVYKVVNFASNLTFFNLNLVGEDKFRILDLGPSSEKASSKTTVERIINACKVFKPRRLAVDPVTMIGYLAKDELEIRQATLNLGNALAEMGITSILCSEAPLSEQGYSRFGVEEYMADLIIYLKHEPSKGKNVKKTMEIIKMRGSTHHAGPVPYTLDENGIVIRKGGK